MRNFENWNTTSVAHAFSMAFGIESQMDFSLEEQNNLKNLFCDFIDWYSSLTDLNESQKKYRDYMVNIKNMIRQYPDRFTKGEIVEAYNADVMMNVVVIQRYVNY